MPAVAVTAASPLMRSRLAWICGFLLVACERSDPPPEPMLNVPELGGPVGAAPAGAADAAALEARARAAMAALPGHADARFANLRVGMRNAVCGELAERLPTGGYGEPHPFLVSPEGEAIVSRTAWLDLTNPDDRFPDFYIRLCATPAELAALAAEIPVPPPVELPPVDLMDLPAVPADPLEATGTNREPAGNRRPSPRPDGGVPSFSDAVIRPGT